ncbi:MAG: hypothetical protein JW701_00565 [Kosmotogaceae bacterium]|nr:hypothetical protein [Kosmotogaceae bacterium]
MGILDRINIFKRFRRRKPDYLDTDLDSTASNTASTPNPDLSSVPPATITGGPIATSSAAAAQRAQMDLLVSQMDSLRIQYDAINSRLSNIERLVAEIRSFCK